MRFDTLVIGGGAAGLFCASVAGRRGRRVAVLEHNATVGRKILISGGGRCNFTNLHCSPDHFQSRNPHFAKSALALYTQFDFIALVEEHGIRYHEKTLGQLFCDGPASRIVDMLLVECRTAGVTVVTGCAVREVQKRDGFVLETSVGPFESQTLVLASGGLSIPKMGATDVGYRIAEQFGLHVVEPRPALAPFVFSAADQQRFGGLSGVSADVAARLDGTCFREKMLFTHQGLSGPAVLQISSYWRKGQTVSFDLAPGRELGAELLVRKRQGDRATLRTVLSEFVPKRLVEQLIASSKPLIDESDADLAATARTLGDWRILPAGTAGFDKAEVTAGGIDTTGLSSKTMESRKVPGLFCIGEVVDVTGHLGGFNFQWAWASGYCAGLVA